MLSFVINEMPANSENTAIDEKRVIIRNSYILPMSQTLQELVKMHPNYGSPDDPIYLPINFVVFSAIAEFCKLHARAEADSRNSRKSIADLQTNPYKYHVAFNKSQEKYPLEDWQVTFAKKYWPILHEINQYGILLCIGELRKLCEHAIINVIRGFDL